MTRAREFEELTGRAPYRPNPAERGRRRRPLRASPRGTRAAATTRRRSFGAGAEGGRTRPRSRPRTPCRRRGGLRKTRCADSSEATTVRWVLSKLRSIGLTYSNFFSAASAERKNSTTTSRGRGLALDELGRVLVAGAAVAVLEALEGARGEHGKGQRRHGQRGQARQRGHDPADEQGERRAAPARGSGRATRCRPPMLNSEQAERGGRGEQHEQQHAVGRARPLGPRGSRRGRRHRRPRPGQEGDEAGRSRSAPGSRATGSSPCPGRKPSVSSAIQRSFSGHHRRVVAGAVRLVEEAREPRQEARSPTATKASSGARSRSRHAQSAQSACGHEHERAEVVACRARRMPRARTGPSRSFARARRPEQQEGRTAPRRTSAWRRAGRPWSSARRRG